MEASLSLQFLKLIVLLNNCINPLKLIVFRLYAKHFFFFNQVCRTTYDRSTLLTNLFIFENYFLYIAMQSEVLTLHDILTLCLLKEKKTYPFIIKFR